MILHPGVIALFAGSILISLMLLYAAYNGLRILLRWDIASGSELQLNLERRTYLISTVMSYAFGFQILSLFLFIYTADVLSPLFVGAMCAAGSLNVNGWGYPTVVLKTVDTILAGLWLVINYTDNKAYDYPLIKVKYGYLLLIAPFLLSETIMQATFFLGLKPNIITSCCGTLFSVTSAGTASLLASLPHRPTELAFYSIMVGTISQGIYFYFKGKGAYLFSITSILAFFIFIAALISFISPYFYELPTHHCPFCILQSEYGYIGYPLYAGMTLGAIFGLGAGAIEPFRNIQSLAGIIPSTQRRFALISVASVSLTLLIVLCGIAFSNLRMTQVLQ